MMGGKFSISPVQAFPQISGGENIEPQLEAPQTRPTTPIFRGHLLLYKLRQFRQRRIRSGQATAAQMTALSEMSNDQISML